jgi:hypothetical protein
MLYLFIKVGIRAPIFCTAIDYQNNQPDEWLKMKLAFLMGIAP